MRVLMLGWDFSPRLSGGVGSACRGLAEALARAKDPGLGVLFVLPRLRGDEEPEGVRLLDGAEAERLQVEARERSAARAVRAQGKSPLEGEPAGEEAVEDASPASPPLCPPDEALRLLDIDSPLRPYLTAPEYAAVVRALLERIRQAGAPVASPVSIARRAKTARAPVTVPTPPAELGADSSLAPLARIPSYGKSLIDEVERYARSALALVQHESFDVIHAHDWMTFPAALLLKERSGKPLVVHFHSCEAERAGQKASSDVRAIEQAALEKADRVLCVSERSARTLREHYSVESARVRVLHNAFTPLASGAESGERDEDADAVVLYLGRLSAQKGPDVFLRAAAQVHARSKRVRFELAGEGELYPELADLAGELGLSESVRFTGFVAGDELARTYARARVYVMPSRAEPFGIGALEALSLGVPTIVARDAGVTEVVRSVLRFEPEDVEELADKIIALLERPALRAQLVEAGLREVRNLRWDRPARALRAVYEEVAHGS